MKAFIIFILNMNRTFFDELVLACEDEILYTTRATSIIDKKVTHEKIIALFILLH